MNEINYPANILSCYAGHSFYIGQRVLIHKMIDAYIPLFEAYCQCGCTSCVVQLDELVVDEVLMEMIIKLIESR